MDKLRNQPSSQISGCEDETALKILGGNVRRERVARLISQQKARSANRFECPYDLQDRGRRAQYSVGDHSTASAGDRMFPLSTS